MSEEKIVPLLSEASIDEIVREIQVRCPCGVIGLGRPAPHEDHSDLLGWGNIYTQLGLIHALWKQSNKSETELTDESGNLAE